MTWYLLHHIVSFILPVFYKRIQGKNIHYLRRKGPVIIAMNHPNAFTDPVCITYICSPLKTHYMARGDAFKPGIISRILGDIGIVPIYRLQDAGREGLKKNDESYREVNRLLKKNAKVIVFAEGLCIQERRLRPVKKGVARMVFGAWDAIQDDRLVVIPVGVNYSMPHRFRSDVFYNVGEPIAVKDYIERYRENPAKTNLQFIQDLEREMKSLITHIDEKSNDQLVVRAEAISLVPALKRSGKSPDNLIHAFEELKTLTQKVNQADAAVLKEFDAASEEYMREVSALKSDEPAMRQYSRLRRPGLTIFIRTVVSLILAPFCLPGLIFNGPLFWLVRSIVNKRVKVIEFYSSFAIGVAAVLFPLAYLLLYIIVAVNTPNILYPVTVNAVLFLSGWLSLLNYEFFTRTKRLAALHHHPALFAKLREKRLFLLELINKF